MEACGVVRVRCEDGLCFNVNIGLCSRFRLVVGDGFVYGAKDFLACGDLLNGFCAANSWGVWAGFWAFFHECMGLFWLV
jgi:hypothetical protein